MSDPEWIDHSELARRINVALEDPYLRVGNVHALKEAELYGEKSMSITLTWMEPGETPEDVPAISALELYIPLREKESGSSGRAGLGLRRPLHTQPPRPEVFRTLTKALVSMQGEAGCYGSHG